MSKLILVIDQGTTGTNVGFFEAEGLKPLVQLKVDFSQHYPASGWVEHDPEEIWNSVLKGIALARAQLAGPSDIAAIGITNQRETVIALDRKTGTARHRAIVWQDRRTADFCAELKSSETRRKEILHKTGLVCDPYFSASKMRWLKLQYPEAELRFCTIDAYLIWRLSGAKTFCTEHTNASRTMLYNVHTGAYDADLCALFGIELESLPEIRPSIGHLASTLGVPGIPDGTPLCACLGDQQSALFGHRIQTAGSAKITYGTGAFLLLHTGDKPSLVDNGLLSTVAASVADRRTFALEGSAFIAGAAVQYLRDNLQWIVKSSEIDLLVQQDATDPETFFVPAFAGLGAPYWNPHARAVLVGLSRGTTKSQIARAVLESVALQNVQILSLMGAALGQATQRVSVDGGLSNSRYLMQFQADALGVALEQPEFPEMTAYGAACAAYEGLYGRSAPETQFPKRTYLPQDRATAQARYARWRKVADWVDQLYR